jgi:hypothetical protein
MVGLCGVLVYNVDTSNQFLCTIAKLLGVLSLVDFVIYVFCEQQGIEPIADVLIIRFTVVWKVLYGLICNSGRDPSFVDVVVVDGYTILCDRVITTTIRFWSHRVVRRVDRKSDV